MVVDEENSISLRKLFDDAKTPNEIDMVRSVIKQLKNNPTISAVK